MLRNAKINSEIEKKTQRDKKKPDPFQNTKETSSLKGHEIKEQVKIKSTR